MNTASRTIALFLLTWLTAPLGLHVTFGAEIPAGLLRIEVQPDEVRLRGLRSSVQLVVTGHFADGEVRDLTRLAEYRGGKTANVVRGLVTPLDDGQGVIDVVCGEQRQAITLSVERCREPAPVSFRNETLAVLTKQGCNSGSCHGKPNGRGALELSLNAFDPAADKRTLIQAPLLRFTHPLDPAESLLLKKPLLQLPHGGGKRLKPSDAAYAILKQWIEEGCQADPPGTAECVKLEVFPKSGRVLKLASDVKDSTDAKAATSQQVRVVAHFSDGAQRDVTQIASFTTSNERIARVDEFGLVTGFERGQTAVVVRYLDDIASTNMTFVQDIPQFVWNNPPENNFVDRLVNQKLRQLQYLPSDECDDGTFFRRLSLDVRGLLPTVAETEEFLADRGANKRSAWIDRFLESPEHARFWGLRLSDLLRINRQKLSEERAGAYSRWVFDSFANNQPYNEFVRELLTSGGNTDEHPAANFFRVTGDTNTVTETVAQLFLGSRVLCAQCHNHPYESWTQDNYYQIGAAFHELDRKAIKVDGMEEVANGKRKKKKSNDSRDAEMVIAVTAGRSLANPRTGVVQKPWPTDVERGKDEDKRRAFAEWLTAAGNPYFARVEVNRIWAHLLGRGLVEPIDDFRSSNPAVNVELLDTLAEDFVKAGFDRRHTLRVILNSRTYQRASQTNDSNTDDDILCSHARTRMLSAEQMQDAITRVCAGTEGLEKIKAELAATEANLESLRLIDGEREESPAIAAAVKQRDGSQARLDGYFMTQQPFPLQTSFLAAFGQPPRETACACERRSDTNLDQALQLMNSGLIRSQIQQGAVRLERLGNEALLDELYVAAVCRPPTGKERARLLGYLQASQDRRQAIEDVVWAVLNTNEFMFQH